MLVALVESPAVAHRGRELFDVGDGDVAGVECLRGALVAAHEPGCSHQPGRSTAQQAGLRRQPRHRTQAVELPGIDRVAVADQAQHLGVEPLLHLPYLDEPGQARTTGPGGTVFRGELGDIEHAFDATEPESELQDPIRRIRS